MNLSAHIVMPIYVPHPPHHHFESEAQAANVPYRSGAEKLEGESSRKFLKKYLLS